ncbi:MAG TPA: hypothetical protein VIX90_12645 [Edaphobacter sp.]
MEKVLPHVDFVYHDIKFIALVIASANFPNTAAVPVAIIFAVLLALTGLVVQFAMRKLW